MSMVTRNMSGRAAWLWIGGAVAALVLAALAFGDLSAQVGRIAAEWQHRLNNEVRLQLSSLGNDGDVAALWGLMAMGFLYGIVHTLGPGHGKAVVVAYFLDSGRKRGWIDGILAGTWISITHTVAALILAGVLAAMGRVRLMTVDGQAQRVALVSYGLIVAIGLWRLHAGLTGRLHAHNHDDGDHSHGHQPGGHGHDSARGHEGHRHHDDRGCGHHDHASRPRSGLRRFFRLDAGLGLLTAAGVAPCAGAVVMVLIAWSLDVLWAGLAGVLAIAVGMAGTLAVVGIGSMAAHRLLIGDRTSELIGRLTTIGAALIVIATAGFLLLGALYR